MIFLRENPELRFGSRHFWIQHTRKPPDANFYASIRKCTPNSHIRPTTLQVFTNFSTTLEILGRRGEEGREEKKSGGGGGRGEGEISVGLVESGALEVCTQILPCLHCHLWLPPHFSSRSKIHLKTLLSLKSCSFVAEEIGNKKGDVYSNQY